MFKTKIRMIDSNWVDISHYMTTNRPFIEEFIYIDKKYFRIINVIHNLESEYEFICVVEEIDGMEIKEI